MITLPIRKDLIIKHVKNNFIGHTEYLQELDKKNTSNMILIHKKIIFSTLTTHIKIKKIINILSKKNYILNKIISLNHSLKKDFNIIKPKILISGINPHAGENGLMGDEEVKLIKPVIKKAKKKGINIIGPFSADSMLVNSNIKKYDCFLFAFHDQALIPYKYISNFQGINFTGNLDIIRVSPDHGTAYNLVGKNIATNKSLITCFKTISKIYQNNNNYGSQKKITRSKFS